MCVLVNFHSREEHVALMWHHFAFFVVLIAIVVCEHFNMDEEEPDFLGVLA